MLDKTVSLVGKTYNHQQKLFYLFIYENEYRTKVHRKKQKIKNTHTMNELIGTHKLYHKINVLKYLIFR